MVRSLAAALFALEQSQTPADLQPVLRALVALLAEEQMQPLHRSFGLWVRALLRRRVPPERVAEVEEIEDLLGVKAMLAERIASWFEEAERKGWEQGLEKGLQEGLQQGLQQGISRGEAQLLLRLLERRFGALPARVEERVAQASVAEIERWAEAMLEAKALEEIFPE